jgi:hypothetical protein
MRLLKTVVILTLTVGLAIGSYLYWLLMTPVNAANVEFRLTNYCYLCTKALQINENSRLALAGLGRGSCSCLAERLVSQAGLVPAAALTEGARRLGVFGLRRKIGAENKGGGLLSKTGVSDKLIAEFAERYATAANACIAAAGSQTPPL